MSAESSIMGLLSRTDGMLIQLYGLMTASRLDNVGLILISIWELNFLLLYQTCVASPKGLFKVSISLSAFGVADENAKNGAEPKWNLAMAFRLRARSHGTKKCVEMRFQCHYSQFYIQRHSTSKQKSRSQM